MSVNTTDNNLFQTTLAARSDSTGDQPGFNSRPKRSKKGKFGKELKKNAKYLNNEI